MQIDPAPTISALGALVAAVVGFVKLRSEARKANQDTTAEANKAIITGLRDEMKRLSDEVAELREGQETQRRQLNLVVTDRDALARYILRLMTWIDGGARPPRPTMPAHLRDAFDSAGVPWPEPSEPLPIPGDTP